MDRLDDRFWRNAVLLIIGNLYFTATCGFIQRLLHGIRYFIRIHNDLSMGITGSTTDNLNQRALTSQEALFIRIQNGNQRNLRYVQTFTKQVDTDQHIVFSFPQVPYDFRSFNRFNLMMQPRHLEIHSLQIAGQIFRHANGQRCNQSTFILFNARTDFIHKIVDLSLRRTYGYHRIQKTCRTNDLFYDFTLCLFQLIVTRCCGDKDCLIDHFLKFFKTHRTVIKCGRKTEAIVYQCFLTGTVPIVHAANLRQGYMGFIHYEQKIVREIIK